MVTMSAGPQAGRHHHKPGHKTIQTLRMSPDFPSIAPPSGRRSWLYQDVDALDPADKQHRVEISTTALFDACKYLLVRIMST